MLKLASVIFYQASLLVFIAYYKSSRFSSIYLKDLFYYFLVVRPVVVVAYTTFTSVCNWRAAWFMQKALRL